MASTSFGNESNSSLIPDPRLLEVLKGRTEFVQNVLSQKPVTKGKYVDVYLVREGAGMMGLTDYQDSLEWAGINNNVWRTARVVGFLAQALKKAGISINVELAFNSMLVFKLGRRRWDESTWYPTVIPNSEALQKKGDTEISLEILKQAGVSEAIRNIVRFRNLSLARPAESMESWENKVCMYADFRAGQLVTSLQERFDDLSRRRRASQEQLDYLSAWAFNAEREIFEHLSFNPEDVTSENPAMPDWEASVRSAYLEDAQISAYARLTELHLCLEKRAIDHAEYNLMINKEFPLASWWGIAMRKCYEVDKGIPCQAKSSSCGIDGIIRQLQ